MTDTQKTIDMVRGIARNSYERGFDDGFKKGFKRGIGAGMGWCSLGWGSVLLILAGLAMLSGCTPYVGYTHLSQPNVRDDGYDLLCGGVEYVHGMARLDVAACQNVAPYGGTFAKVDARILFGADETE